jgi:TolB-like protein
VGVWGEVKQRRITQIVVAYLAAGWMAATVVDQLVNRSILPEWTYPLVLTVYLFGIGAAFLVGWYHGEKGVQKAPMIEIVALTILALGATGVGTLVVRRGLDQATIARTVADSGADLTRIGVLYFADASSGGTVGEVADGITEGLIRALAQVPELDVTSRNGAEQVRGLGIAPDSIARILDVGTLIDGTVDQVGEQLRVSVRVLEGQSGVQLFRESYEWPAADVAAVSDALAAEVAIALREQLGQEIRLRQARASAPNSGAWLQVARAEGALKNAGEAIQAGDAEAAAAAFQSAADELDGARESAPDWAEPLVLRGQVAYERYVLAESEEDFIATLDEAVELANLALDIEPDNAGALELRGTANYRKWLFLDEQETSLFESARTDLEQSLTIDRSRATANSTLSHLYYQTSDWPKAVLAARSAYEQDAFLAAADGVLWRLYAASYDMGEHREADRWCAEGRRRFANDFRFVQCQLFLLTMPQAEPDVEAAWSLSAALAPLIPERPEFYEAQAQLLVGGVIGRAGLPDSANAVLMRARRMSDVDPEGELQPIEAAMRSVYGDVTGAVSVLERFVSLHPEHPPDRHWWWTNIEADPAFRRLIAAN